MLYCTSCLHEQTVNMCLSNHDPKLRTLSVGKKGNAYDLRSASAAIYYLFFKAVIVPTMNELLFTNHY